ncbi:MAG: hypothetical protein CMO55_12485 [Verrucomicrobiales bacterium]|nr:hypothetical protein [Verrucomicrobiales bacterium]
MKTLSFLFGVLILSSPAIAIERVTLLPGGGEQNGFLNEPKFSSDGSYVAFSSSESDFHPDERGFYNVYGWVRDTMTFELLSRDETGLGAGGDSFLDNISANGRYVTFRAESQLVSDDGDSLRDIYVRDRTGMTTTLASRADGAMGDEANAACSDSDISDNGQYVVFISGATNLVTGVTSGTDLVYLRDTVNDITILVSKSDAGTAANAQCFDCSISADGRYVAFRTSANNLLGTGNDTNGDTDAFVVDLQANPSPTISRASLSSSDAEIGAGIYQMDFAKNGTKLVFSSKDTSVVPGVAPTGVNNFQVYVRDLVNGTTTHASRTSSGTASEVRCDNIAISNNGNYVSFYTKSNNIGVGDSGDQSDVFAFNVTTGKVTRVSVAEDGTLGDAGSTDSDVSDTAEVVFKTSASNFDPGDTGADTDYYIAPVDAPSISTGSGNAALRASLLKKIKKFKKKLKRAKKKKKVAKVKKFKKKIKIFKKKLRAL